MDSSNKKTLISLIVVLILFLIFEYYNGFLLNKKVKPCLKCDSYNVNGAFEDDELAAEMMMRIDNKIKILADHLESHYGENDKITKGVVKLVNGYDNENMYEISPHNIIGKTSFLRNKRLLVLCLRRKSDGKIHDENTLIFVVLHELAHMMNETYGHDAPFWEFFKFILECAVEIGIYIPVDYKKNNIQYCGLTIEYSPLYD